MKNLQLYCNVKRNIPQLRGDNFHFVGTTSRSANNELLFVIKDNVLYCITIPHCELKNSFNLNDIHPSNDDSKIIGSVYNDIYEEVHTFYETGEVISLKVGEEGKILSNNLEFIADGIVKLKWSPNQETAVILNQSNEVLVVNTSFEILNKTDLLSLTEGEQKTINVGWGKKETQFKGSAGKKIANEEELKQDSNVDTSSVITWRGDSLLFAITYWCESSNKRRVKIFDKGGILQSTGEDLPGLEVPICWRPQGNLIATTQRFLNRYVVAFIEKNGLKHGDFNIPKDINVNGVYWNAASNILILTAVNSNENYVMFWTTGNYHWYMKLSIKFNTKLTGVAWDEVKENRLYVLTEDGELNIIEVVWSINHSSYSLNNTSYISVIDNDKVFLTPFDVAIIPPPMCKWTLDCKSPVNQILYSPDYESKCGSNFMCAVLRDNCLSFFSVDKGGIPVHSKTYNSPWNDTEQSDNTYLALWEWVSKDCLICCGHGNENSFSQLVCIQILDDSLKIVYTVPLNEIITLLSSKGKHLLLQTENGKFIEFDIETKELVYINLFPEPCSSIVTVDRIHYGLSESKRLYIGERQVANNVTSFFLKQPFLLATTSHHALLILKYNGDTCEEVSLRKLERGSKIILVTGNSVVMQLPRGNLEIIQPRALTIVTVGSLLDDRKYKEAVSLLRKQRINFDLCVDHNFDDFIANVDKFVEQVDQQWITIMVTELSENDVTRGVYAPYYNKEVRSSDCDKISSVCNAILEALVRNESKGRILAQLSCLVKMKKMSDAIDLAKDPTSLQHLLFLVGVETLYQEALGSYNISAALKIAEKSEMDPKEYVPYLNSLLSMETNYMKYSIDKSLKRAKSALIHIAKCDDRTLDECYALIVEYNLYSLALELFQNQPQRYSFCASLYGDYLNRKKCFEEAGIMFVRGNKLEKAIESFTKAGNWRQSILLAKQSNFSDEDMEKLNESLFNELISSQAFSDAGQFAIESVQNIEKGIEAYIQGKFWQEAIYIASKHKKDNLKAVIKQNMLDTATNFLEDVNSKKSTMKKYIDRLAIVKLDKLNKPKFRDFDEMSDTSSSTSSMKSNQSFGSRSSKMTRKMSRKMWSLKEGNPREEEALIAALGELMQLSSKYSGETKNICCALLHFKEDKLAGYLQQTTKDWLQMIEKYKKIIWPRDPNEDDISIQDEKLKFAPHIRVLEGWELESLKHV